MNLTWKYVKPLKETDAVKKFLKTQKITLPSSLISIIEKYNGGRPSEKSVITETNHEYVFKALLSYNDSDKETIYKIYPELFKASNCFPFASDTAGNFICYDRKKKKYVLYNHETGSFEQITKMVGFV
ncbi:MAG: SMI1/KNR4 family protein [Lachnospiraceae bacterium]|nr:SMI1/KNR4 family protein [Lachnospiraceae bacterium]